MSNGRLGRVRPGPGLAGVLLGLLLMAAFPAAAEKGAMQLGLESHYVVPQMDLRELTPNYSWGVNFHYWLNSTTSIELGFEQLKFLGPLEVDGQDDGITFSTGILEGGARYRPELDLWLSPYLEAGLGYEFWQTAPGTDLVESRSGGRVAYFAGGGVEYRFRDVLELGLNLRYFYLPMDEKLERKVFTLATGQTDVIKTQLEDVRFLSTGVELRWRFK